jgi:hypothetical protein
MQGSCRCQAGQATTRHLVVKKIPRPLIINEPESDWGYITGRKRVTGLNRYAEIHHLDSKLDKH